MSDPIPPSDIHAEKYVLGSVLLDPRVIEDVTLAPADFYRPAHEKIWSVLLTQHAAREPIDVGLIGDHLRTSGDLDRIGGLPYLFELYQCPLSAVNVGFYAEIVGRLSTQRRIILAGQRIVQLGYSTDAPLAHLQQEPGRLVSAAISGHDASTAQLIGHRICATLDELEEQPKVVPTGIQAIDHVIGGLGPGRLYVVGARPGVGKSVLGIQLASEVARTASQGVLVASLEMSEAEIHRRIIARMGPVDFGRLEHRRLTSEDWNSIAKLNSLVSQLPLAILDAPNMGMVEISRAAKSMQGDRPLGLVVVDYLQLMRSPAGGRTPRHEVVSDFSRGLKLMARELECPVLALSQLNRASEQRQNKEPSLGDLRESGAVEQDADVVLLLHRDMSGDTDSSAMTIHVAKNRNGPASRVDVVFRGYRQEISDQPWSPSDVIRT